jgi:hypothetical protein
MTALVIIDCIRPAGLDVVATAHTALPVDPGDQCHPSKDKAATPTFCDEG